MLLSSLRMYVQCVNLVLGVQEVESLLGNFKNSKLLNVECAYETVHTAAT